MKRVLLVVSAILFVVLLAVGYAVLRGPRADVDSPTKTEPTLPRWASDLPLGPVPSKVRTNGIDRTDPLQVPRRLGGGAVLGKDTYFLDVVASRLLKVSADGRLSSVSLDLPASTASQAPWLVGVAATHTGVLLVSDLRNAQLWLFAPDGRFLGPFLTNDQRAQAKLTKPLALALDRDGRVYVSDAGDQEVKVFNKAGALVLRFGGKGFVPGKLSFPTGLIVGGDGRVYVADSGNRRVQVFDSAGKFVRVLQATDTEDGLVLPRSVGLDRFGRVHVVDSFAERVSVFTSEGAFVASYGFDTKTRRGLHFPEGITVTQHGVVVGDQGGQSLVRFSY